MDITKILTSPHLALLETVIEYAVEAVESIGESEEETLIRHFNELQTKLIIDLSELCPPEFSTELIEFWNETQAENFRKIQEFILSKIKS